MNNEKDINELEPKETENKSEEEKIKELFSDYVMKDPEAEEAKEDVIETPNRPAHWSQRIAAGLIDMCILFLSIWGLYSLFTSSAMADGLKNERTNMQKIADSYKLVSLLPDSEETYGYKLYEGDVHYDEAKYHNYIVYTEAETSKKYKVVDYDGVTDELAVAYQKAVTENKDYQSAAFNYRLMDFGIIVLAGTISETVFLFVIPLINKNRASIGKLAAGLKVINSKYLVEAKWYQMLGRLIWTLSFESAIPLLFLPSVGYFSSTLMTAMIVPLILFIITLTNKDRRTLHDFICRTRVIDKRTFVPLNEQ